MIRFITLLTVTLLLTISCSGVPDADSTQVTTFAPTATVVQFTPTSTPEVIVKQVPVKRIVVVADTPIPTQVPTQTPVPSATPDVLPTPTSAQIPTSTPLPIPAPSQMPISTPPPIPTPTQMPISTPLPIHPPTQEPAIVGTIKFLVDVDQVATASQLELSSIGGPSLIRLKDERYRLYLHSRTHERKLNIISLISTDGSQWDVEPGVRIPHGSDSDIDSEVGEPAAYLGLDDKYYMAYTGRFMGINPEGADEKMHRVVFAISDDALTWSKLNQHYADPQNRNNFASSSDVNIIDGEYVIYYTGGASVIRATSLDGLTWERQNIIFWGHDSTTIKYDDTWYMFARMPKQLRYSKNWTLADERLVVVVSHDGVNWSNNYYQVVVENADGSEVAVEDSKNPASVLLPDGSLRVFLQTRHGERIYSIKPAETLPK